MSCFSELLDFHFHWQVRMLKTNRSEMDVEQQTRTFATLLGHCCLPRLFTAALGLLTIITNSKLTILRRIESPSNPQRIKQKKKTYFAFGLNLFVTNFLLYVGRSICERTKNHVLRCLPTKSPCQPVETVGSQWPGREIFLFFFICGQCCSQGGHWWAS